MSPSLVSVLAARLGFKTECQLNLTMKLFLSFILWAHSPLRLIDHMVAGTTGYEPNNVPPEKWHSQKKKNLFSFIQVEKEKLWAQNKAFYVYF